MVFQDASGEWSQQSVCLYLSQFVYSQCAVVVCTILIYSMIVWWRRVSVEVMGTQRCHFLDGRREMPPLHRTTPCLKHALPGYDIMMVINNKLKKSKEELRWTS